MSSEKKVMLTSSDSQIFLVDESVASQSQVVKNMMDFFGESPDKIDCLTIPLKNVCGNTLGKVIQYCKYHLEAQTSSNGKPTVGEKEVEQWDAEFVKVDQAQLLDLLVAANYLDIKELLDLTCQAAASMLKSKTVEEIRTIFNIQSDFTPEEEEKVKRDNQWAFE